MLYVLGGSNSRRHDGWVRYLERQYIGTVTNLSIGAATSLMAIYRMLLDPTIVGPATIIWEYALNEVNHIKGGYERRNVLRHLEHTIRLCRQRGLRLAPVIFTPQREEEATERNQYFHDLHLLFNHYGLQRFDVSTALREANGWNKIPTNYFADEQHYEPRSDLLEFIAGGAIQLVRQCSVPRLTEPLYCGNSEAILVTNFATDTYQNAILTVPVATAPVRLMATNACDLTAIYAICRPDQVCGMRVRHFRGPEEQQAFRFSATSQPAFPRPILKAISVEKATGRSWRLQKRDRLVITPARTGGMFHGEYLTIQRLKDPVQNPKSTICGLLFETVLE